MLLKGLALPGVTSIFYLISLLVVLCRATTPPYDRYVLSPRNRTVQPVSVLRTTGSVTYITHGNNHRSPDAQVRLTGPGASITWDFGQQTGGVPTFDFEDPLCNGGVCLDYSLPSFDCNFTCQALGLSYTESEKFVGAASDDSIYVTIRDGTLYLPLANGEYTVPAKWGRGGFRYLTLSFGNNTAPTTSVSVKFSSLYYTAAPILKDPGVYTGYFYSSDELLNRIWYAGAYTLQLCTIAANSSVDYAYLPQGGGWSEGAIATNLTGQESFLSNGAKHDRNPWSGDVSVSLRSALVVQNYENIRAVRNTLQEIIILQDKIATHASYGYFPYAGSPLGDLLIAFGSQFGIAGYGSDTYNLWTIAGFAEYVLATNDVAWGQRYWPQILTSLTATYGFVDANTGLFNGTRTLDWGRVGQGGENIALNALYYNVLSLMIQVAPLLPSNSQVNPKAWNSRATKLKTSVNSLLYDSAAGLYKDNTTSAGSTVHPQDGNAFAITFNLTSSAAQAQTIAANLAKRHTIYGAPAPELPSSISPFITCFELRAQFAASNGDASTALSLLRTQWGYMLQAFSNSTFIEGYGGDGSLSYSFEPNPPLISHTHSWSTGPVYSLQHEVVGLHAMAIDTAAGDGDWAFKPTVVGSGLTFARGGFNAPAGNFTAGWRLEGSLRATLTTPAGLSGTVYVPTLGQDPAHLVLFMDGMTVHGPVEVDGSYFRLAGISGGSHSFELQSAHGDLMH